MAFVCGNFILPLLCKLRSSQPVCLSALSFRRPSTQLLGIVREMSSNEEQKMPQP